MSMLLIFILKGQFFYLPLYPSLCKHLQAAQYHPYSTSTFDKYFYYWTPPMLAVSASRVRNASFPPHPFFARVSSSLKAGGSQDRLLPCSEAECQAD